MAKQPIEDKIIGIIWSDDLNLMDIGMNRYKDSTYRAIMDSQVDYILNKYNYKEYHFR